MPSLRLTQIGGHPPDLSAKPEKSKSTWTLTAFTRDLAVYLFQVMLFDRFRTTSLMSTPKLAPTPALPARLIAFALEALKLVGIALGCLALIGMAFFISVRSGIVIPARWFGLCFWTGFLVWIICRPYRSNLGQPRFWGGFLILLVLHVAGFAVVLRVYPEWRMAWFPLIAVIEIPLMAMGLELIVRQKHRRKHASQRTDS
jgi:hypothetical protein